MEKDSISYTELDFELIKIEVKEMEKLIIRLKDTFVGSSVIVDQLEVEVRGELSSQYINNKCPQLSVVGLGCTDLFLLTSNSALSQDQMTYPGVLLRW